MKQKLKIVCPLGILLAALALSLGIRAWSAGGQEPAVSEQPVVAVATMTAQEVDAPARNLETLAPVKTVGEADENPNREADGEEARSDSSGYHLTEQERIAVECAVMCEAGGEGTKGQMMVAQCILDGTLRNDYNIFQTIEQYKIASTSYGAVTDQVKESVSRVFDDGERVTEEKADLWYNPALVTSAWHESQQYVITVGSHRFFWMNSDMT